MVDDEAEDFLESGREKFNLRTTKRGDVTLPRDPSSEQCQIGPLGRIVVTRRRWDCHALTLNPSCGQDRYA